MMTYRFLAIACVAVTLVACAQTNRQQSADGQQLRVAASFYPLWHIASRIGHGAATVTQVIPNGVEPHDYEPTPEQIASLHDAKLVIMNGQGVDPWADNLSQSLTAKGITIVSATANADLLPAMHDDHEEHEEEGHEHGALDPHVWLDPVHMMQVVRVIRDAMIANDPTHADMYARNADAVLKELHDLDAHFTQRMAACKQSTIIVSHDAFRYMARRYGFDTIALAGISPDEEPSAKKIAEIIEIAKREKLQTIFFETLVSPKLAETVAAGANAKTLVLNPIEGLSSEDIERGETYFTVMQKNADNLAIALECQ